MSPRVSIVAGLVAGVITAGIVLGGVLVLAPESVPAATASPSPSPVVASPSAAPDPSVAPSASAASSPSAVSSDDPGALFGVGLPAPPLVVPQVGGGEIDLTNLRGKAVWVNFMGTYCPPCVDEFPLMESFANRYAEDGLVVLAIDVEEEEGVVLAFADGLGTTFPLGLDLDGSAAEAWGAAAALPVHFWIDVDGVVRDGALGGIGPDIMAEGVSTILPGVEVTPP